MFHDAKNVPQKMFHNVKMFHTNLTTLLGFLFFG